MTSSRTTDTIRRRRVTTVAAAAVVSIAVLAAGTVITLVSRATMTEALLNMGNASPLDFYGAQGTLSIGVGLLTAGVISLVVSVVAFALIPGGALHTVDDLDDSDADHVVTGNDSATVGGSAAAQPMRGEPSPDSVFANDAAPLVANGPGAPQEPTIRPRVDGVDGVEPKQ